MAAATSSRIWNWKPRIMWLISGVVDDTRENSRKPLWPPAQFRPERCHQGEVADTVRDQIAVLVLACLRPLPVIERKLNIEIIAPAPQTTIFIYRQTAAGRWR